MKISTLISWFMGEKQQLKHSTVNILQVISKFPPLLPCFLPTYFEIPSIPYSSSK